MELLNKYIRKIFRSFGRFIGTNPYQAILFSLTVFAFSLLGFSHFTLLNDFMYLFTPSTARAYQEKSIAYDLFPMNEDGRFDLSRKLEVGRYLRVLVQAKNHSENILKENIWKEVVELDELIQSVKTSEGKNYSSLCSNYFGECFSNDIIGLSRHMEKIESGELRLAYPLMLDPETFLVYSIPHFLYGLTFEDEDNSTLIGAEAMMLFYFLSYSSDYPDGPVDAVDKEWEIRVMDEITNSSNKWEYIQEYHSAAVTFASEHYKTGVDISKILLPTVVLAVIFSIASLHMKDCVESKAFLGMIGIGIPLLASLTAIGILLNLNVPFIVMCVAVPFLTLGIGVDDMFVMIAAWRRTSRKDDVPTRMANCYEEASVSITITTITDVLSFIVGSLTPIPSIRIFSCYAAVSVAFAYFYELTFFGALMALSGRAESKNMNGFLVCHKAIPKSESKKLTWFQRNFMVGGSCENSEQEKSQRTNLVMEFFGTTFSRFISHPIVQVITIIVFILYLLISYYGAINIDEGIKATRLFADGSHAQHYRRLEDIYFRNSYPYRIQVMVTNPMNYSDVSNQEKIFSLLNNITSAPRIIKGFQENWLQDFLRVTSSLKEFDPNITIKTEADFINTLMKEYNLMNHKTALDVKFNENRTAIIATRYIVQSAHFDSELSILETVVKVREIADNAHENGLNVTLYCPIFSYIDQYGLIRSISLKLMCLAAGVVFSVAVIFIPHPVSAFCVFVCIGTIEFGIFGFMSLWNVSLDFISLIALVLCVGFSIDFVAHISYSFVSARGESAEKKLSNALHAIGLPILQAAISTLIALVPLGFSDSYVFTTFFKVTSLVILFALAHAIFFLPVFFLLISKFLSIINCCPVGGKVSKTFKRKKSYDVTEEDQSPTYEK